MTLLPRRTPLFTTSSSLLLLLFATSSLAHLESPYFPGYGFSWYHPVCAYACFNTISGARLSCSDNTTGSTSAQCYASNQPFQMTLAYCMNSTCDPVKVPTWQREEYWATMMTGDKKVIPKWDYSVMLEQVKEPPTVEFNSSSKSIMNETQLVSEEALAIQSRFMILFDHIEMLQARYAIVLVIIGFGTPIFFTLLSRLPFMTKAFDKIKPYLVYPSLVGTYHVRPLPWLLGNAPTIGQALYIAMFFILNLVLSSVNYSRSQPHPWGFSPKEEMLAYIGYRTGHIGYALLPLVILFSGRNNFLLWVTNWSHSTYMVLHRWVARIFAVQAIIHSITLLITYQGTGSYATASKKAYWLWGIVATVLTCAMLVFSHLYFRRHSYEVFLILHIVLAALIIVGCWYHVVLLWGINFYDNWLYAACAVWFFDRLLRVVRIAKNGTQRAVITEVGRDHVRVDVPGVRWASRPGYVAYAYFPTLSPLRPWENHPFSINSTSAFRSYKHALVSTSASLEHSSDDGHDVDKAIGKVTGRHVVEHMPANGGGGVVGTAGVTLVVKKSAGLTRLLKAHAGLLTLIDGPYRQNSSDEILACDRLLLIGGGIGIMGLVAFVQAHPNVKLAWSVKSSAEALVHEMGTVLGNADDKQVVVGERLNIESLLRSEAEAGYDKVGVVVCGPGGMCDDVRARVAGLGRGGKTVFELEVDAFSW